MPIPIHGKKNIKQTEITEFCFPSKLLTCHKEWKIEELKYSYICWQPCIKYSDQEHILQRKKSAFMSKSIFLFQVWMYWLLQTDRIWIDCFICLALRGIIETTPAGTVKAEIIFTLYICCQAQIQIPSSVPNPSSKS